MYIDAKIIDDEIRCWVRKPDNTLSVSTHQIPYYFYAETDKETDIKSIYNVPLERIDCDDYDDYQYERSLRYGTTHEADINPVLKFLSDEFHDKKNDNLNIGYYDIEVDFDLDDGLGYPTPDNPYGEINSISLFDKTKQRFVMIILHDTPFNLVDESFPVDVYNCATERQVLDTFHKVIDDIDIITAWNGDGFDLPYIFARAKKIYGDSKGLKLLSRDGYTANEFEVEDDYGNKIMRYRLYGRVHLDMMEVYKKSTFKEQPSYALDFIADVEKVGEKIKYTGDLGRLYREDPKRFFEYSLHDSRLLYQLDEKTKIMKMFIVRSQSSTVLYNDMFGSIKPLEMKIRNYVHYERAQKMALPDLKRKERESFEGAFVIETKAGIYSWSSSIDLASLYPSVVRSCNISPETHLLQCSGGHDDFVKVVTKSEESVVVKLVGSDKSVYTTGFGLHSLIKEQNLTISANGSIFTNNFRGLLPEVLDRWVAARNESKNKMFEAMDRLKELKDNGASEEEIEECDIEVQNYDTQQKLAKLDNNALYGAVSNIYCRFFTIDCAKSITLTGQLIEKHQIYTADQILQREKIV